MKFMLRNCEEELIPFEKIKELIIDTDDDVRTTFDNFLKNSILDGELLLRGKTGFPVDVKKVIEDREAERFRKGSDTAPQRIGLRGKPSPPLSLAERVKRALSKEMPEFMEKMFLTKGDLANWLQKKGFECEFQVEKTKNSHEVPEPARARTKPRTKLLEQEKAILDAIKQLGYDPLLLPRRKCGHPWVKSEVRQLIASDSELFESTSFDKAWERLRKNREIGDSDTTPHKNGSATS